MRSWDLICVPCDTTILWSVPDPDHCGLVFGFTRDDRAEWTSRTAPWMVVHRCDPKDRALVRMVDPRPLADPWWAVAVRGWALAYLGDRLGPLVANSRLLPTAEDWCPRVDVLESTGG